MSEYIKREDAEKILTEAIKQAEENTGCVIVDTFTGWSSIESYAKEAMSDAPSADVVEVVRCKDCNNADYAGCPKGRCYCMEHGTYFNSDDYCSYGEREDGEKE